ncbi:MetQ/NlpA family ABC transporter substrate-binding protein [Neobacillus kokaensis]|uniref:Ethanolamine utilization protein EutG n=1 Tax=Neobacillus kokaensis TaxID=2759023 RepID=A0ABQ3N313_9BACI|nr:MetQ/NlpA family ABC transporter substrate-binding protein [Neobacillus kokaensis]GHH97908.1 ethanolamine utilization protein EutG [Neobacillus kokaensis]
MKRLVSWLAAILVVFSLVGCSSSTTSGTSDGKEKEKDKKLTTVSVGYMPNYASLNSIVAGMKTGTFKEQGIEVKLVEFADGPTIIAALESGSIDVGYIGPGAHVLPIQGQAEIFAFSQLGNADEVIGNVKKGVKTIQDLKGKTIAVATGTSSEQILTLTLAEAGLTTKDVKLMNMDASAIVTAMISGSVDAVATWSPNTNAIKKEMGDDVVMLSNNKRYADKSPSIASWVVKPGYADQNKDLLEKFTRGLFKGMDYRTDHLDEVAKWVAEEIAVDPKSVLDQTGDGEWITTAELVKRIDDGTLEAYYQKQQENFVEAGRLKKEEMRPVSEYVLFDNMKKAAQ